MRNGKNMPYNADPAMKSRSMTNRITVSILKSYFGLILIYFFDKIVHVSGYGCERFHSLFRRMESPELLSKTWKFISIIILSIDLSLWANPPPFHIHL